VVAPTDKVLFLWLDETFSFGSVTGSVIKKEMVMVTGVTQCRPGDFTQRRGPHTHVSKLEREEGGKKRQENRSQFRVRLFAQNNFQIKNHFG
jgi:hypothetical protein